jgi:hypothetical protein
MEKKYCIACVRGMEYPKDLVSATTNVKNMLDSIEISINISDGLTLLISGYIKNNINMKYKCVFVYEFSSVKSKKDKRLSTVEKLLVGSFHFDGYVDLVDDTDLLEKTVPSLKSKVKEKEKEFANLMQKIKMLCRERDIDFREYCSLHFGA